MSPTARKRSLVHAAIVLALMLLSLIRPTVAHAQGEQRIVRVGWFESPFNIIDEQGRRSGYAYDYQQEIAAYTGWTYEYVVGSWSDLLSMLAEGKIDLLSDVSYTDERAQHMLFSSLPMGTEKYYLYADPQNKEVNPEDYATFNGKKVGANEGSVQVGLFQEWAKANGVKAEVVELSGLEKQNLEKLSRGDIDLYLSMEGFFSADAAVPVCQIGTSDYFFAVSKSQPELLVELNNAMGRIHDDDQYLNQQLYAKYLQSSGMSTRLSATEKAWLDSHGAIRVGYQDNYLAFCATDPDSGELTGALKDYLEVASNCMENATLDFTAIGYPTAAAAMDALANGEVDCVFPANLTAYDGETYGVFVTPALMRTDMSAVVREADQKSFAQKDRVAVAVNVDNPNYDLFLQDHFPDWRPIYFANTQECLKAVADGQADCLLISNYRYNNIAKLCEKYSLASLSTGIGMDYCMAVNREDTVLYSILSKAIAAVPDSTVNAALSHYYTEDARTGVMDSLNQNLLRVAVIVLVVVALILLAMLLRGILASRGKGDRKQRSVSKEDFALFDDLPISYSVYHVSHVEHSELYDAQIIYVNRMFQEYGGLPEEAAVGRRVRELFPYTNEEWFANAKRAALDGQAVEYDYDDPLTRKTYHATMRQVVTPGYCAITYQEA